MENNWINIYINLNKSYKKKLVFRLGADSGFFSEFNNMVFAILYCLKYEIRFILSSKQNTFAFNKGWQDYFKPFCLETEAKFHVYYNVRGHAILDKKQNRKIWIYKLLSNIQYFTQHLWSLFHSADFEKEYFKVPVLGINGDIIQASQQIISNIWNIQPDIQEEIRRRVEPLYLPEIYIGIHIRSGDKIKEDAIFTADKYINYVKSITNCQHIFIATDDYRNVQHIIDFYPEFKVYTLCKESAQGYDQITFAAGSLEQKKEEVISLLTDIEVINAAQSFVGTFSSNIGMFQVMRKGGKNCYSVEGKPWRIR